jgi:hypothetical protein
VQTVTEEFVPQDRPESYDRNIVMTDVILNAYLQFNKNCHDVLAKTRESAYKTAVRSGVVTRNSKKKIMEDESVPTFTDLYTSATKIMWERNRLDGLRLRPIGLSEVGQNLNDGKTLFKTISYFLTQGRTTEDYTIYEDETLLWIAANLDTPISDNTDRVFRDIINVPLYSGYPEGNYEESLAVHKRMEREYYLNYIRSPTFWNDFVFLLAVAHLHKLAIHVVTSLADDSIWHSTFYPLASTINATPISIFCLDMIYFTPLIQASTIGTPSPSSSPYSPSSPASSSSSSSSTPYSPSPPSSPSTALEDDPEFVGTSREKWCYMAHEHSIRGHPITRAQQRKFWYECKK